MSNDDLGLLGIRGAAQLAGCDRTTILRAIRQGNLKAKLVPTPFNRDWWGISPADLDEWITKRGKRK